MCTCVHICVEARGQLHMSFLKTQSTLVFKMVSHTYMVFTISTRLTGHRAPSVTLALGLQIHASHNAQLFNVGLESSGPHVCSANTLSMRLPKWCQKRHQAPQGHHRVPLESRKGHCSCCAFALVGPHSPLERLAAAAGSGWSPFAAKEGSWGEARQSQCHPNFVRSSLKASASLRK